MLTEQEVIRLNLANIKDCAVGYILERHAFSLTQCTECLEHEFVHEDGCSLAEKIEDLAQEDNPDLGPLIYYE